MGRCLKWCSFLLKSWWYLCFLDTCLLTFEPNQETSVNVNVKGDLESSDVCSLNKELIGAESCAVEILKLTPSVCWNSLKLRICASGREPKRAWILPFTVKIERRPKVSKRARREPEKTHSPCLIVWQAFTCSSFFSPLGERIKMAKSWRKRSSVSPYWILYIPKGNPSDSSSLLNLRSWWPRE